jgi:hypothetical protein
MGFRGTALSEQTSSPFHDQAFALGPLVCWLPLLLLDSNSPHHQQAAKIPIPPPDRPAAARAAALGTPHQRHQTTPVRRPSSTSRTTPTPSQALSRPRAKSKPTPSAAASAALKRPDPRGRLATRRPSLRTQRRALGHCNSHPIRPRHFPPRSSPVSRASAPVERPCSATSISATSMRSR